MLDTADLYRLKDQLLVMLREQLERKTQQQVRTNRELANTKEQVVMLRGSWQGVDQLQEGAGAEQRLGRQLGSSW